MLIALLQGCSPEPSSAVGPDLAKYSPAFQKQAAAELKAQKPPCAADVANEHCSALHRLTIDYGNLRDKIRAWLGLKA